MTEALGLLLRLDDDCVHGIDIMSHESLELKNFSLFDGVNIPFNDNEFDFLSIFQVTIVLVSKIEVYSQINLVGTPPR